MHLHALATALPPHAFTQSECWDLIKESPARARLSRRTMLLLQGILRGDSGVKRRHFATPDPGRLFDLSADELNATYRATAPALAADALARALAPLGHAAADLDALFVCSCTGYLCPGVTSYVAERMGVRRDAFLLDVQGHGCGAAIPTMRAAHDFLTANPGALVATVAVEICSAAFYLDDDPGVIVSACIFADGAAAAIWRNEPGPAGLRCDDFTTLHRPEARDLLRFEQRNGKLRNLLDAQVPQLAADAVKALRPPGGLGTGRYIVHPGGREVILAVEAMLGESLPYSRTVLENCGNMSSPSVLFVLEEALKHTAPAAGGDWWLASFGAGFAAHGCRVAAVAPVAPRSGLRREPAAVAK